MAEDLEQKVGGFWDKKFEEFDDMGVEGVRNYMLEKLYFLKDNMATPYEWNKDPKSVQKEVYEVLNDLQYARFYLTENPEKFKELHALVDPKNNKRDKGEEFARFVICLTNDLCIAPPGDLSSENFSWARNVRERILYSLLLLEKGTTSDFYLRMETQADQSAKKIRLAETK